MYPQEEKPKENKIQLVADSVSKKKNGGDLAFQFVDNRPNGDALRKLQEMANNSTGSMQLKAFQIRDENISAHQHLSIQKKESNTDLPDNMKSGIENLTGGSTSTIQRYVLNDQEGAPMPNYDTDDLDLFEQSLNVIHMTEENPIVFITLLINQLKRLAGKGDKNVDKALRLCRNHRVIRSRGDLALDKAGLEEVMSVQEFDDLIRDFPVEYKGLPQLITDAKALSVLMAQRIQSISEQRMSPEEKMQYMTTLGDTIMVQVMHESTELLGLPQYGMAVYATGGFGRGETSPGSDLDFGVVGDDRELLLIRSLTSLMMAKINLARSLMAKALELDGDVKAGLEADPLWLQSPKSVSPTEVVKHSAIKGTPEDARLSAALQGSDVLTKEFDTARSQNRDPERLLEGLSEIVYQYEIPKITENEVYNIKESWIRLMTLSMQKIGGFLSLKATGTLGRFDEMKDKGLLDPILAINLRDAFVTLMGIRQKLHSAYKGEKDEFFTGSEPPPGLIMLPHETVNELIKATEHLMLFKEKLNVFVRSKGKDGLRAATKVERFKNFLGIGKQ